MANMSNSGVKKELWEFFAADMDWRIQWRVVRFWQSNIILDRPANPETLSVNEVECLSLATKSHPRYPILCVLLSFTLLVKERIGWGYSYSRPQLTS